MRRDVKKAVFGVVVACATLACSSSARADASSWAFVGAGAFALKEGSAALAPRAAMTFDVGVGTTPDAAVIFGGLFRVMPIIDEGTDLALCARIATRGFQAAQFGVALDLGGYQRLWGSASKGFTGALTVGFPLGFSLSFQGQYGTGDALALGAVAGIDFARMTVYRQSLLESWPNPYPAQQTQQARTNRGPSGLSLRF